MRGLLKGVNFCVIFAISQRISEKKRKMCFRYGKIQDGGWKPNKTIEVVSRTFFGENRVFLAVVEVEL